MDDEITSRKMVAGRLRLFKMYTCQYCGKGFEGRADIERKYCSRECSDLSKRLSGVRIKGQHAFYHKCMFCEKDYWNLSRVSKYCSRECHSKAKLGKNHPLYKNGIYIDKYKHVLSDKGGYVIEHRQMVENAIGRKLERNEDVHHINQNKLDNRLENLALLSRSDHTRIHHYLKGNGNMTKEQYQTILDNGRIVINAEG